MVIRDVNETTLTITARLEDWSVWCARKLNYVNVTIDNLALVKSKTVCVALPLALKGRSKLEVSAAASRLW